MLCIIGDKYGKLTPVEEVDSIKSKEGRNIRVFKCQCDCGNYSNVRMVNLRSGNTRSCGCLNARLIRERQFKDITNNRYGKLKVLHIDESVDNRRHSHWRCVCDCGNYTTVKAGNIISGGTRSCGCSQYIRTP